MYCDVRLSDRFPQCHFDEGKIAMSPPIRLSDCSAKDEGVTEEVQVPTKPRNMWVGEAEQLQQGSSDFRGPPKRRITIANMGLQEEAENTGSYKQIYQQKQRRQLAPSSRTNSFNGGVDLPDYGGRDSKDNGYRSEQRTPRTVLDPISEGGGYDWLPQFGNKSPGVNKERFNSEIVSAHTVYWRPVNSARNSVIRSLAKCVDVLNVSWLDS
ncbi:hypothetical protein BaRGS_00020111 [Batillaria attramentaria]|uniref:Uncharacterized protein n=1 Tax=Batillaria attramentaria TaxID=370345 RepID=A0ABD0KNP1_9CAEN